MNRTLFGGRKLAFLAALMWLTLIQIDLLPAQSPQPSGRLEATSALGRKLFALPDDARVMVARDRQAEEPLNPERALALSQALAAVRQYREAVIVCDQGLAAAPRNADLYVERGHRELGLRRFKPAIADFNRALQLQPQNLDAHYDLGLAYYFLGRFSEAAASFEKARNLAKSNDSLIDCSNWLYASLRRAGKEGQAAEVLTRITPQVTTADPHIYVYLRLLQFYQGQLAAEALKPPRPSRPSDLEGELRFNTVNYALGNWRLYNHDALAATSFFKDAVAGEAWNSWGFIAAEAELARLGVK